MTRLLNWIKSATANPGNTTIAIVVFIIIMLMFFSSGEAKAGNLYIDAPFHVSTAGSTPFNRGRNNFAVGWETDDGFQFSLHPTTVGSTFCHYAGMSVGKRIGTSWNTSLNLWGKGECGGRKFEEGQLGVCATHYRRLRHWELGIGPCLLAHGDLATGYEHPKIRRAPDPARNTIPVLAGNLHVRFNFGKN